jgi:methionyl-tRNA formyltransferase
MAIDTLATLNLTPGAEVVMCLGDPRHETVQSRLANVCAAAGVPYRATRSINDTETVAVMRDTAPDYLVSANNFQIFKAPSLAVPLRGVVNFHNAPLPRYAGLNACSWALFNGEVEHGVTWHFVDRDIDSGPILAQSRFAIDPDETAIGLISRCIREGSAIFRSLAADLVAGRAQPKPQDQKDRLYFGLKERPWNGELPWWESAAKVKRLARALSFHPMPNMFYRPRFAVDTTKPLFAEQLGVENGGSHGKPGTLVEVTPDEVAIELSDGLMRLRGLYDESGQPVDPHSITEAFGLHKGRRLVTFGN